MLAGFSCSVMLSSGRTVCVQPLRQIVWSIVCAVTSGFSDPGVHRGSGSEYSPEPVAWQESGAGWGCTTLALALETASMPRRELRPGFGLAGLDWFVSPCARRLPARCTAAWCAVATMVLVAPIVDVDDDASVCCPHADSEAAVNTVRIRTSFSRRMYQGGTVAVGLGARRQPRIDPPLEHRNCVSPCAKRWSPRR